MTEIWKDIKGYEGLYQLSNYGRVKALEKYVTRRKCGIKHFPEIIMKPTSDKDGYLSITFNVHNKAKTFKVHRLVAQAFIPNPKNKPQVNHKDGNKKNNHVDNLEWATESENIQHAYKTNLMNQSGENNVMYGRLGADNPNSIPIYQLNKYTDEILHEYDSMASAGRALGVNISKICECCKGRRLSAYGYKWKYK